MFAKLIAMEKQTKKLEEDKARWPGLSDETRVSHLSNSNADSSQPFTHFRKT